WFPACCSNGGLAGCGVNALFGLRTTPPAGGVVLSAAGFFPPDRKRHFRLFFNLLIIHIKNIGTPFANNLTSLSGVINDQPKNHCARNRVCGCRHSGGKLVGEANRAGC
ncbi:hypothetical protein, partial [Escherichia coli]|uniref:hypothetical protein n=1 Tax=Escherichia coli TaxID=562 RepID=UPI001C6FDC48